MAILVRETSDTHYKDNGCICEERIVFYYDTEEEKMIHKKEMEEAGWTDSEQIKENIGTINKPCLVWVGKYYQRIVINM